MSEASSEVFQLVYEGPGDSSALTLQKIKGVFIADLDLSVEQIQKILLTAPVVIQSADTQDDLQAAFNKLNSAGAKVFIVQAIKEDSADIASNTAEIENKQSADEKEEFLFELDLDEPVVTPIKEAKTKPPKVYHLDVPADPDEPLFSSELIAPQTADTGHPEDSQVREETPLLSLLTAEERQAIDKNEPDLPPAEAMAEKISLGSSELTFAIDSNEAPAGSGIAAEPSNHPAPSAISPERAPLETFGLELDGLNCQALQPSAVKPPEPPPQKQPAAAISPLSETLPKQIAAMESPAADAPMAPQPNEPLEEPAQQAAPEHSALAATILEASDGQFIPTYSRRPRELFRRIPIDTFVAIAVGIIIIAAANLYFFSTHVSAPTAKDAAVGLSVDELIKADQADQPAIKVPLPRQEYIGYADNAAWAIHAKLFKLGEELEGGSIRITTAAPPELSKEEIVQGVPPRIWLKRIEISLSRLSESKQTQIEMQLPAFAYLQQGRAQSRATGTAKVTLSKLESGEYRLALSAWSNLPEPDAEDALQFAQSPEGSFQFSLKTSLELSVPAKS